MINIPTDKAVELIKEKTGLTEIQIKAKIKEKVKALRGLISESGAVHIVANELGVKLDEGSDMSSLKIKDLMPGARNIDVCGKITRKFEVKTFSNAKGEGKIGSFIMADETGTIRCVLWNDKAELMDKFEVGDVIKFSNCYVRENNLGNAELQLGYNGDIIVNPEGVEINVDINQIGSRQNAPRKKIAELNDNEPNVELLGYILQVFDIKFWDTCPTCNKKVIKEGEDYVCKEHGTVKNTDYRYVLNLIVDDGSGNIRSVLWSDQIKDLLKLEHEEIGKFREDGAAFDEIKMNLLGELIKFRGKVQRNQTFNTLEFTIYDITRDVNLEQEMENMPSNKETVETKTEVKIEEPSKNEEKSQPDLKVEQDFIDLDDIDNLDDLDEL